MAGPGPGEGVLPCGARLPDRRVDHFDRDQADQLVRGRVPRDRTARLALV